MRFLDRPLRVLAVMGKESIEVIRRPRALVGVVAGPMLILGLFGLGFVGQPPLRTDLVIPIGLGLPEDPSAYASDAGQGLVIRRVTADRSIAVDGLRRHETDLVVVAPPDAADRLAAGEQVTLSVEFDSVSPYQAFVARAAADQIVAAINRRIIEEAARRAGDTAAANGQTVPAQMRPEFVAAPTRADAVDLAPSPPTVIGFYGLLVLALVVQHTSVTISALSTLRDRRTGAMDLFRLSPIGSSEILLGKYLAFTVLGTIVAMAVLVVLVIGFGVPFLAPPGVALAALALLVMASTGIGIVIALVSDSERQAMQSALLVLLASVFFSGLAVDLAGFSAPVRAASELLPVTQAGRLLQELMLRGSTAESWRLGLLAAIAGALAVDGWIVLRRQLRRPD